MNLKTHIRIALSYFILITLMGVVLRLFQIGDISINYKFTLHAHSHVALLGWVYTALTTLIYKLYLIDKPISKKYRTLFWFTQGTIVGMLITFPHIGYAIPSIILSTLFLFATYRFLYMFLKNTSKEQKKTYSYKWIRTSLWFMVISSLGPWVLGFNMNTLGSESVWYRNSIYFYLHFQYNGWILVALFGMLFNLLELKGITFKDRTGKWIFWSFNFGVILTFFLSILWMKPDLIYYVFSGLGGVLQIIAFIMILKWLFQYKEFIRNSFSKMEGLVFRFIALLFMLKLIFQFLGAFPEIAQIVSTNRDLIIGYLHWVFLGVVSISIFAFSQKLQLMIMSKRSLLAYFLAFILSEILIFYKGIMVWLNRPIYNGLYLHLFIASTILFLVIGYILYLQKNNKKE